MSLVQLLGGLKASSSQTSSSVALYCVLSLHFSGASLVHGGVGSHVGLVLEKEQSLIRQHPASLASPLSSPPLGSRHFATSSLDHECCWLWWEGVPHTGKIRQRGLHPVTP